MEEFTGVFNRYLRNNHENPYYAIESRSRGTNLSDILELDYADIEKRVMGEMLKPAPDPFIVTDNGLQWAWQAVPDQRPQTLDSHMETYNITSFLRTGIVHRTLYIDDTFIINNRKYFDSLLQDFIYTRKRKRYDTITFEMEVLQDKWLINVPKFGIITKSKFWSIECRKIYDHPLDTTVIQLIRSKPKETQSKPIKTWYKLKNWRY